MRRWVFFCSVVLLFSIGSWAQDQFIKILDFEEAELPNISAGWTFIKDFAAAPDPVHGGLNSMILDITEGTGGWTFGTWTFPTEVGTLDLSNTDEIRMWVYATDIFQINLEFGGANLGYRHYNTADSKKWKELIWWYPEENTPTFTEVTGWGTFINPSAFDDFPEGFTGQIYFDDIRARVRKAAPAREYYLLNGFNSTADLQNVTVSADFDQGIITSGDPAPEEGKGYLAVGLSDAGNDRFSIDLTNVSQVMQYDRIHFSVYMDGTASGGWGNFGLHFDTSIPDAGGTTVTNSLTLLNGSYSAVATQQWHEFAAQYGPVTGTDGFAFPTLKSDTLAKVYSTAGATLAVRFSTNGGGVDGVTMYIDNVRLSREQGTKIAGWELY